jgi:Xaa-Pro aminopeptidase
VTGFTGSAGTALVTSTQALLWTDGRYFDQAARQLSPAWTLMRQGQHDIPTIPQWLRPNLDGQSVLGRRSPFSLKSPFFA